MGMAVANGGSPPGGIMSGIVDVLRAATLAASATLRRKKNTIQLIPNVVS
jgi:hypothetical protein